MDWSILTHIFEGRDEKIVIRIELRFIGSTQIGLWVVWAWVGFARLVHFDSFFYFKFFNDYILFSNY